MATFRRLLGFLRPYRRGLGASGLLAAVAMVMTAAIPWLTGRAIDQMREGDRSGLRTLALAVLAAGVLRLALTVVRRLLAGRVSLGVELDLRQRMYGHLQSLELAFFDRQQTGQLMSRATVDLQSVRFFLGYGLIFMLQSALTIVLAAVAMFITQPRLAAISLLPVPFVVLIAARYGHRSRPALQELQQRIAELTADVEENVGGVRVVKAFAREDRQLDRFRGGVGRIFDQAMVTTRLQAFYNPFIGFLPQVGLAAILFIGGREVIRGDLTIGQFSAFYTYLLMLLSPMRTLGISLGLAQRATAAGARLFQILDRAPRIVTPADAAPLPAGNGHVELRHVTLRVRRRRPPRAARRLARRAGRHDGRARRRDGLGQDDARPAHPAPLRRHRRRGARRRRRRARGRPGRAAPRDRDRRRQPVPLLGDGRARTSPTRAPTPRPRRSSAPPAARRRTTSSSACPTATTRASASAGSRCPAASASASRSHARSSPTRAS